MATLLFYGYPPSAWLIPKIRNRYFTPNVSLGQDTRGETPVVQDSSEFAERHFLVARFEASIRNPDRKHITLEARAFDEVGRVLGGVIETVHPPIEFSTPLPFRIEKPPAGHLEQRFVSLMNVSPIGCLIALAPLLSTIVPPAEVLLPRISPDCRTLTKNVRPDAPAFLHAMAAYYRMGAQKLFLKFDLTALMLST